MKRKFGELFIKTKALQQRSRKLNRKREVIEFKPFDKQMDPVKLMNALGCLLE